MRAALKSSVDAFGGKSVRSDFTDQFSSFSVVAFALFCNLFEMPTSISSPDRWISQLLNCQHLPEQDMKVLCDRVRAILMEESNVQPVSSPVTICGDIHGQFWDLLELLRKGGMVPETNYIFMVG
jgi:hypothetical protein